MNTIFKIFKIEWDITKLEGIIKKYQEEFHLEVRNIMVLRNYEDGADIGVIFERVKEIGEQQNLKPDKWSFGEVEAGLH